MHSTPSKTEPFPFSATMPSLTHSIAAVIACSGMVTFASPEELPPWESRGFPADSGIRVDPSETSFLQVELVSNATRISVIPVRREVQSSLAKHATVSQKHITAGSTSKKVTSERLYASPA